MDMFNKALLVAQKAHSNQEYEIFPYIYHPMLVSSLAEKLDFNSDIIIAAMLHDVLEDDSISYSKLVKHFNREIAEIVFLVTDEKGRNRKEKHNKTYPAIRENWKATIVKVLDRISNIEQSYKFNPDKLKMYLNENKRFKELLYSSTHLDKTKKVWDYYNDIIKKIMRGRYAYKRKQTIK